VSDGAAVPEWLATYPKASDADGSPVHATIARWLTDLMSRGDLVPGDRLPREGELAKLLGVSRMTLRQALATLEARGCLQRRTGRAGGTFVIEPRIECDLTGLAGFTEQMRRAHVRAGAHVVSSLTLPAPPLAASALSLARGATVHEIVRVRTVARQPLALERSYFPAELFADLRERQLTGSLYQLLSHRYGQEPTTASESFEPVAARADEAEHLSVELGDPLMLIERTAFNRGGRAIEFARDLFRPDRIKISLRTSVGQAASLDLKLATP
jgi:GntR family transcriptional regulator